jgi:hypothetical protein
VSITALIRGFLFKVSFMLLVPKALVVNLELIANTGTTPLDAFIMSAVETHICEWHGNEILEKGSDAVSDIALIHIDTVLKIAREIAFIFSMSKMNAHDAVGNLIKDGWLIEHSDKMYFMPQI